MPRDGTAIGNAARIDRARQGALQIITNVRQDHRWEASFKAGASSLRDANATERR